MMRLSDVRFRGLAAALLALGLLAPAAAGTGAAPAPDPQAALAEGNRLFREGRIEAAAEAYLAAHSPSAPHPTLTYNLGAALHHLGRLPEAILWYRRAAGTEDPWREDNLWLARRSLGSQVLPAGGALGWLGRHQGALRLAAIALGWTALLLLAVIPRIPGWVLLAAAAAAAALYGGAAAVERWGPRPAVIVEDCHASGAELPAGTEAWVRPDAGGRWSISGPVDVSCPPEAVELVFP